MCMDRNNLTAAADLADPLAEVLAAVEIVSAEIRRLRDQNGALRAALRTALDAALSDREGTEIEPLLRQLEELCS